MKRRNIYASIVFPLITIILAGSAVWVAAQGPNGSPKTNSKIEYHNGPVMSGAQDVYLIWYGCWQDDCDSRGSSTTTGLVTDFVSNIGGSPYFQLNHLYPNSNGNSPTGAVFYAGSVFDRSYSHGNVLTEVDLQSILRKHIESNALPQDPVGIYLVLTSADIAADPSTGFCRAVNTPPLHGLSTVFGVAMKYGFIGNPARCPTLEAPQFVAPDGTRLPTANGDFAGDSIATKIAHVLNTTVTNPTGSGWYDRYGLANADKCQGTFGQTYATENGARANIRLGYRHYLIGQNWVNDRRGRCGMQLGE